MTVPDDFLAQTSFEIFRHLVKFSLIFTSKSHNGNRKKFVKGLKHAYDIPSGFSTLIAFCALSNPGQH